MRRNVSLMRLKDAVADNNSGERNHSVPTTTTTTTRTDNKHEHIQHSLSKIDNDIQEVRIMMELLNVLRTMEAENRKLKSQVLELTTQNGKANEEVCTLKEKLITTEKDGDILRREREQLECVLASLYMNPDRCKSVELLHKTISTSPFQSQQAQDIVARRRIDYGPYLQCNDLQCNEWETRNPQSVFTNTYNKVAGIAGVPKLDRSLIEKRSNNRQDVAQSSDDVSGDDVKAKMFIISSMIFFFMCSGFLLLSKHVVY